MQPESWQIKSDGAPPQRWISLILIFVPLRTQRYSRRLKYQRIITTMTTNPVWCMWLLVFPVTSTSSNQSEQQIWSLNFTTLHYFVPVSQLSMNKTPHCQAPMQTKWQSYDCLFASDSQVAAWFLCPQMCDLLIQSGGSFTSSYRSRSRYWEDNWAQVHLIVPTDGQLKMEFVNAGTEYSRYVGWKMDSLPNCCLLPHFH